jgi:hypothetical protein
MQEEMKMSRCSRGRRFIGLSVLIAVAILTPVGMAQTFTPPRHPEYDQPNLEGIWQVMDQSVHFNVEPHEASFGVPAGTGVIVDPPDGLIPYTPAGLAERARNVAERDVLDPYAKCYKPGVPHLVYLPFPFQIVQSENLVTIMSEYIHNTRFIWLHRDTHFGERQIDLWNGDSVGSFDGDTLVTDVFNFHPDVWLDRAGNHSGPDLRVTERLRLVDADTLEYTATLTDPENYTEPWTMRMRMYRHKDPGKRILEYECHAYAENSLGPPELPAIP